MHCAGAADLSLPPTQNNLTRLDPFPLLGFETMAHFLSSSLIGQFIDFHLSITVMWPPSLFILPSLYTFPPFLHSFLTSEASYAMMARAAAA